MRREGREPLPDHAGESPLLSRSGGEKGLRGSGAGTLGFPLEGTRRVGGLLGVAGRLSGTVSPFRAEQGTSLETPSRARASSCQEEGTTWFFSSCGGILELGQEIQASSCVGPGAEGSHFTSRPPTLQGTAFSPTRKTAGEPGPNPSPQNQEASRCLWCYATTFGGVCYLAKTERRCSAMIWGASGDPIYPGAPGREPFSDLIS